MKKFFFILSITFIILVALNIAWLSITTYFWVAEGITFFYTYIDTEANLIENIFGSTFVKWILLADILWLISLFVFMLQRKHFKI